MPNADANGIHLAKIIKQATKNMHNAKTYQSLGWLNYLSCLQYVDIILGNSSSAILEAPSFGKVSINIGDRQKGRLKNKNVFDVPFSEDNIIQKYNSIKKLAEYSGKNIFFKKNTAEKIIETIKNYVI